MITTAYTVTPFTKRKSPHHAPWSTGLQVSTTLGIQNFSAPLSNASIAALASAVGASSGVDSSRVTVTVDSAVSSSLALRGVRKADFDRNPAVKGAFVSGLAQELRVDGSQVTVGDVIEAAQSSPSSPAAAGRRALLAAAAGGAGGGITVPFTVSNLGSDPAAAAAVSSQIVAAVSGNPSPSPSATASGSPSSSAGAASPDAAGGGGFLAALSSAFQDVGVAPPTVEIEAAPTAAAVIVVRVALDSAGAAAEATQRLAAALTDGGSDGGSSIASSLGVAVTVAALPSFTLAPSPPPPSPPPSPPPPPQLLAPDAGAAAQAANRTAASAASLPDGALAGAVVGAVVGAALCALAVVLGVRMRRRGLQTRPV